MSHEYLYKRRVIGASDDLSATGVGLTYFTPVPMDLYRVGFINAANPFDAGSFAFEVNINAAGAADVISFTGTTTTDETTLGAIVSWDVNNLPAQTSGEDTLTGGTTPQTSLVNIAPEGPIRVKAGSQVEVEITTGATAGTGYWFIEFIEHDSPNGLDIAANDDYFELVNVGNVTIA